MIERPSANFLARNCTDMNTLEHRWAKAKCLNALAQPKWIDNGSHRGTDYLFRGKIDCFTRRLNTLQPILDLPLQLRTGFLWPLQIQYHHWISIAQGIKLTNPAGTSILALPILSSTFLSMPVSRVIPCSFTSRPYHVWPFSLKCQRRR